MLQTYFSNLYNRTMEQAYGLAFKEIAQALANGGDCLDCGASTGNSLKRINTLMTFDSARYHGVEWNRECAEQARAKNLDVVQGDLNKPLPFESNRFQCVFGLSVLEHLLYGCAYMKECHRVLDYNGTLVLLTPNISTFFTIALLLVGKMPSTGPHPDSNILVREEEVLTVRSDMANADRESDTPMHRHLVVFSFRVLKRYLSAIGFSEIKCYGFGLYPFPKFMQPLLEKVDPYHCHQMVFVAQKNSALQ